MSGTNNPPKVASDNTLRQKILNHILIHEEHCAYSLYDQACDCIQQNVADNIMQAFTAAVETVIKDCTYRYHEDEEGHFEAVDKEMLEQRLAEMVGKPEDDEGHGIWA